MTDVLDSLVALLVAGVLYGVVIQLIHRYGPPDDRAFLARVYTWTLALRYVVALILNLNSSDPAFAATFWGDSATYDIGGYQLSRFWSGEIPLDPGLARAVSGYGFYYVVGAVYWVFGRNQLLVQFLNGAIGGISVLVLYAMARRLFSREAAQWAARLMAFFPGVIFWSTGMYKDPAILLCVALCMYAVIRLRERVSLPMVLLFAASGLALVTLRFYIFYFVAFAAFATAFFSRRGGFLRNVVAFTLLFLVIWGAFGVAVKSETREQQSSFLTLERLQITRADQAMWGRSAFGTEHDVSTPTGAISALPVGLVYLIFAPFPWMISGLRQMLTAPEMLVWYGLMPAFVRGVLDGMKHRLREILPVLVFILTLTPAYALFQGNVGTAYRQRTQVTMFFFVFMGVGIAARRTEKALGARRRAGGPAWQA